MIASAPTAIAAEKLKLSVGGYMEQWVGYVSSDDGTDQDFSGFDVKSDAEIHFKGMTKLDNGMSVGVNVQLEANSNAGDQIDESYLILKGAFGEINLGSENSAMYKMHYAPSDYGIGLNSGDNSSWTATVADAEGDSISKSGTFRGPFGSTYIEPNRVNDSTKITYYTPRVSGFQLGVSYSPDGNQDANGQPNRDTADTDYVMVGANFVQKMGGMNIGISAGYGTVTDSPTSSSVEPNAMSAGIKLGMGGLSAGIAMANYDDHGANNADGITAGVAYSSGPMGVSLAYFHGERDGSGSVGAGTLNGQAESDTFHLSGKYALGPGVTFAGTLGHQTYSSDDVDLDNSVDEVSATYVVMGLKVGF
jgi:predicted porin